MKLKKEKRNNFLDYIPVRVETQKFHENEEGYVVMHVERKSLYDKIAQILRKRTPKCSYYTLDSQGSFVWNAIDGEKNIYEIGKELKDKFGEEAEPLYPRLAQFVRILDMNRFITLK